MKAVLGKLVYRILREPPENSRTVKKRAGEMIWGSCDPPGTRGKAIRIHPRAKGLRELDTIIHEALHALDFDEPERVVARKASDIARLLWNMGYRK